MLVLFFVGTFPIFSGGGQISQGDNHTGTSAITQELCTLSATAIWWHKANSADLLSAEMLLTRLNCDLSSLTSRRHKCSELSSQIVNRWPYTHHNDTATFVNAIASIPWNPPFVFICSPSDSVGAKTSFLCRLVVLLFVRPFHRCKKKTFK